MIPFAAITSESVCIQALPHLHLHVLRCILQSWVYYFSLTVTIIGSSSHLHCIYINKKWPLSNPHTTKYTLHCMCQMYQFLDRLPLCNKSITLVVHSRRYGGRPWSKFPPKNKKQLQFSYMTKRQYWLGKTTVSFQINQKCLQQVATKLKNYSFNGIFYWLTDWLTTVFK